MSSNEFVDRKSQHLGLPLPSPGNQLRQDVLRLIDTINALDSQFKQEFVRNLVSATNTSDARQALGIIFGLEDGNVLTAPSFGLGAKAGHAAQLSRTPDNKTLESGLYQYSGEGSGLGTSSAFINLTADTEGRLAQLGISYLPDDTGQRLTLRTLQDGVWTNVGSLEFKGKLKPLDTAAPSSQRPQLFAPILGKGVDKGALEIREAEKVAQNQTSEDYAPRIVFNWQDRAYAGLALYSSGRLTFEGEAGFDTNGPLGVRSYNPSQLPDATQNKARIIARTGTVGERLVYSDGRYWRDTQTQLEASGAMFATQTDYEYDALTSFPKKMTEIFGSSPNQRITTYTYNATSGYLTTVVEEYLGVRTTTTYVYTGTILTRQTTARALI